MRAAPGGPPTRRHRQPTIAMPSDLPGATPHAQHHAGAPLGGWTAHGRAGQPYEVARTQPTAGAASA